MFNVNLILWNVHFIMMIFYTLSSLSEAGVNAIGSKSPTLIFLDVKSGFTM